MPSSIKDIYTVADTIMQRAGAPFKGTRSWRRLVVNGPLSQLMASGDYGALPGVVSILTRLGGWTQVDMAHNTLWEIYTSTATDQQAADLTAPNTGRTPANGHRVKVQQAALAALTSAPVGNSSGVDTGVCAWVEWGMGWC